MKTLAIMTYVVIEFKETHLGPLKNSLSSRSTSTSTIKPETPAESIDEKASIANSNDIGTRLSSEREVSQGLRM